MVETWREFMSARNSRLAILGDSICEALSRHDTAHPVFHGCFDWHSAVHGTYALLAVSRLTGDESYRSVALRSSNRSAALASEEEAIRDGSLVEELPYGFAWMLHLDIEAGKRENSRFHGMAQASRDHLLAYFLGLTGTDLIEGAQDPRHGNLVWALFALYSWARLHDDAESVAAADRLVVEILRGPFLSQIGMKEDVDGFLSPLHLLAMICQQRGIEPDPAILNAIRGAAPLASHQIRTPYRAGLNFSRAWGCYAAWLATDDLRYRNLYVDLVATHVGMTDYWRDDYLAHGHWVAQFGVFALALSESSESP